jgi:hypothetical protein
MSTRVERVAAALELLPEDLRENVIAYLVEQAEKFRVLKQEIDQGTQDVEGGRITEWNFAEFLRRSANMQR